MTRPGRCGQGENASNANLFHWIPWRLRIQRAPDAIYPDYHLTAAVLRESGLAEDFASDGPIRYTHRSTRDREIYFLANRTENFFETTAVFRAGTGAPELWDPLQGAIRLLPQFVRKNNTTELPLRFDPYESYFVVFPANKTTVATATPTSNFPTLEPFQPVPGPWTVSFDPQLGGPPELCFETLEDWTKRPEPGVKFYSGIATYRTKFEVADSAIASGNRALFLDLGQVQVIARVRVNTIDCGVAWTHPWRVDVTRALNPGTNVLEIEVANLWPNRMIGDAGSERKFTRTTYHPYKATDPLLPSGLLGPVRLLK